MRLPLLFFFLLFWCGLWCAEAKAAVPAPAAGAAQPLDIRYPNPQKLQELRKSRDFQYAQDIRPDMSFWERFWRRVSDFIARTFSGTSYSSFWKYVLYAIAIGTTVFVILKLLQVDFVGLFSRKTAPAAIAYDTYRENIHEIDFRALLEEAEAQRDFRRAIRLHYLRTLKNLTDQGLIDWKPGKTNRSYVQELNHSALKPSFERVTQLFEYVWYGGSALNQEKFEAARQVFVAFNHSLSTAA